MNSPTDHDEDNDRTVLRSNSQRHEHNLNLQPFASENALPLGTRLGEFEIRSVIGEGGFGIVYLAYDSSLDRMVAVKEFMPASMASRIHALQVTVRSKQHVDTFAAGLKSFVSEARLLARFDSASLVKVYRFWEENGTAYMVMPFYEGLTLRQVLREGRADANERWLRALLVNLLDAIETIHSEQCYHRDIAPDNILILKDGRPLLLDFGAARRVIKDATHGLTVILKPGFAPIEQYADTPGMKQGPWTDIYALAAVAYFVIVGKAPPPSVARLVGDEMVSARMAGAGRYSDELLSAVDRALAVHPNQRIQNVAEFRSALAEESGPRTMPGSTRTGGRTASESTVIPSQRVDPQLDDWPVTLPPNTVPPEQGAGAGDTDWQRGSKRSSRVLIAGVAVAALIGIGMLAIWLGTSPPSAEVAGVAKNPAPVGLTPLPAVVESPAPAPVRSSADSTLAGGTPPTTAVPPGPTLAAAQIQAPAPPASTQPSNTPAVPMGLSPEDEFWRAATARDTVAGYEAYLKRYPRGKHVDSARMMLYAKVPQVSAAPTQSIQPGPASSASPRPSGSTAPPAESRPSSGAATTTSASRPAADRVTDPPMSPPQPQAAAVPEQVRRAMELAAPASAQPTNKASPASASASASAPAPAPARQEIPASQALASAPSLPTEEAASASLQAARTPQTPQPSASVTPGTFTRDPTTGLLSGTGHFPYPNGDRYEGRLVNGFKEGRGVFQWANGERYNGEWVGDVPHGQGTIRFASGHVYTGTWVKGKPQGKGEFVWTNGQRYEGEWLASQPHGEGRMKYTNGDAYAGQWVKGQKQGRGQFIWANGQRYTGDFANDEPHGQGSMRFVSGDTYTGEWSNGKHHGRGKYTWANGIYWEGEFADGKKTGNGRTVFTDGTSVTSPGTETAGGPPADPRAQSGR